jgi:hypothetical protein
MVVVFIPQLSTNATGQDFVFQRAVKRLPVYHWVRSKEKQYIASMTGKNFIEENRFSVTLE